MNPSNPSRPTTSLYVGNLHKNVTEVTLYEKFSKVGPVSFVHVCRNEETSLQLGYGFVTFVSVVDAENAIDLMNFDLLNGKKIRLLWTQSVPSHPTTYVDEIVRTLKKSIDKNDIFDTFTLFKNILSGNSGKYDTRSTNDFILAKIDDLKSSNFVKGISDEVRSSDKQKEVTFVPQRLRDNALEEKGFRNVYVKNFGNKMDNEDLANLFQGYGHILNCVVIIDDKGNSRGYGFVSFERCQDAKRAVEALNGKVLDNGRQLYVCRSHKKTERAVDIKDNSQKRKTEHQCTGTNLYVKNLDDSIDDLRLREIFSAFGNVTSAKVLATDRPSKGFAFVCFATPMEAKKAVVEMNGKIVGTKPLYVAMAHKKEDRRANFASQCMKLLENIQMKQKKSKCLEEENRPKSLKQLLLADSTEEEEKHCKQPLSTVKPSAVEFSDISYIGNPIDMSVHSPYQLEHLPQQVPVTNPELPKRTIGHYPILLGHSKGNARQTLHTDVPLMKAISPRPLENAGCEPVLLRRPRLTILDPKRPGPRLIPSNVSFGNHNHSVLKLYGIGRGIIPHPSVNFSFNTPGIR